MKIFRRAVVILCLLSAATPTSAQELVADLSQSVVAITTGFAGSELLLFGATEGKGDVVVVIRGPERDEIVRRKKRVASIWINRDKMIFENVPSYYWLASNRPLQDILPDRIGADRQIGLAHLKLAPIERGALADIDTFRSALIRGKQRQQLYGREPGNVTFVGKHLFRTKLHFPSNVAVGAYGIDVYLMLDGEIAVEHSTRLTVGKVGIEADIFNFAHRHAALYGILAILIAAMAGWLANVIFRKD